MHLGFSSECINPTQKVELSGYGWYLERYAEGILDNLYARAVYFKKGSNAFMLINCDLLGLGEYVVCTVKRALSERLKLSEECITLLSIHTHNAPSVVHTIGCGEVNPEYVEYLIEKLISVGLSAKKELYLVSAIDYGKKEIESIGYNRVNSSEKMDTNVYALRFVLKGHKPYVILQYGCHPVVLGPTTKISQDYPGNVLTHLQNHGYEGMFITGCCGDINPIGNKEKRGSGTQEILQEYGSRLIDGAVSALQQASTTDDKLKSFSFDFEIELNIYETNYYKNLKVYPGIARAAKNWIELMAQSPKREKERVFVQVLKLGGILLIFAPGELVTKIGMKVRNHFCEYFVLFCQNANYATRYIATDDSINNKNYDGFWSNVVYMSTPLKAGADEKYITSIIEGISKNL